MCEGQESKGEEQSSLQLYFSASILDNADIIKSLSLLLSTEDYIHKFTYTVFACEGV